MKTSTVIFTSSLSIFLFISAINFAASSEKNQTQQNHAPVVKITSPANNSASTPGAQVHYSVSVSDKEDGESKYDEINLKEVLLEVKYFSDDSKLAEQLHKPVENDPPGLAAIRTSNCFDCHSFNSKVIGPSFNDINKKYKPTPANMILLEKSIREGSSGVWGNVKMPTHPELNQKQIEDIVKWIMRSASMPGVDFYIGAEGMFSLPQKSSAFLLTASYIDHGTSTDSTNRLKGQDRIIIRTAK
jgi:cytochrome c